MILSFKDFVLEFYVKREEEDVINSLIPMFGGDQSHIDQAKSMVRRERAKNIATSALIGTAIGAGIVGLGYGTYRLFGKTKEEKIKHAQERIKKLQQELKHAETAERKQEIRKHIKGLEQKIQEIKHNS